MPRFDVITFDCYGTLIDWRSGIRAAFQSAGVDPDDALRKYMQLEPEIEQGYRPYREVLREVGQRIAPGVRLDETLPSWKPFVDTNAALQRLRAAGIRLGILSNVDDDLLAATRKHFTVDFDVIVTAQQVRSYKPGHAHFIEARRRIGDARWLHAAQSDFHDIVPANELQIPNAWINRLGERALPGGEPAYEFPDLAKLAEFTTAS
ncbi:MAG TPA: HAD-IA family hydrolase [Thermoanaerobaculia bacterium]|nr:HAD-IA family hydrolase [Thermoanaerobaculia bacterium]